MPVSGYTGPTAPSSRAWPLTQPPAISPSRGTTPATMPTIFSCSPTPRSAPTAAVRSERIFRCPPGSQAHRQSGRRQFLRRLLGPGFIMAAFSIRCGRTTRTARSAHKALVPSLPNANPSGAARSLICIRPPFITTAGPTMPGPITRLQWNLFLTGVPDAWHPRPAPAMCCWCRSTMVSRLTRPEPGAMISTLADHHRLQLAWLARRAWPSIHQHHVRNAQQSLGYRRHQLDQQRFGRNTLQSGWLAG